MWIVTGHAATADVAKRLQWIADVMNGAEDIAIKIGITTNAICAQAAVESGWGSAKQGNWGLFGEKADPSWTGLKVKCPTREWVIDDPSTGAGHYVYEEDWFRDFATAADCLEDHFSFLDKPMWHEAGVFDGKGDEAFYAALKKGGYATDPNYVSTLMKTEDTLDAYYLPFLTNTTAPPTPLPPRVLHIGLYGNDVTLVQSALKTGGLYVGALDGNFGPGTYDAVMAFQTAKKITVDGVVGNETRKALGIL